MQIETQKELLEGIKDKILNRKSITDFDIEDNINYLDLGSQKKLLQLQISPKSNKGTRRFTDIELHAGWINDELLKQQSSKILDLGCGPGFYSHCLSRFGHQCTGIDISGLAIDYAKRIAEDDNIHCQFIQGNFINIAFPQSMDLVIMPYSMFNQLNDKESEILIKKIFKCLKPTGHFYLESLDYHPQDIPYRTEWYTSNGDDYYCASPHLCMIEKYWEESCKTLHERYYIFDLQNGTLSSRQNLVYLYTKEDYQKFFKYCGFKKISFPDSPSGTGRGEDKRFISILATKF